MGNSGLSLRFIIVLCLFITTWQIFLLSLHHQQPSESSTRKRSTGDNSPPNKPLPTPRSQTVAFNRTCVENPYLSALTRTPESIGFYMDRWVSPKYIEAYLNQAKTVRNKLHGLFFPFAPLVNCNTSCIGGSCGDDEAKLMCGVNQLSEDGCIVYSIGGNNLWQFELDLLEQTQCEIHTFDCTGPISRFQKPDNPRLHFHHVCIGTEHQPADVVLDKNSGECMFKHYSEGKVVKIQKCGETWTLAEMQQRLGHSRIDLFKIDTEGWEWPLFESWPLLSDRDASSSILLPMQILVEVHFKTKFPELQKVKGETQFKSAADLVHLNERFIRMGYAVVSRKNNPFCGHCSELTLVRLRCPSDGVYGSIAKS